MLVSQCQAIHARSLIPCQDTPDVKSTFDFNFRSPLPVLASGLFTGAKDYQPGLDGKAGTLLYTFRQDVPIPSYLFAVASGCVIKASYSSTSCRADINSDIATAPIGPRSVVATSADKLKACQWEVEADTERFIQTAEVCLSCVPCSPLQRLTRLENCLSILVDYIQYLGPPSELPLFVCLTLSRVWR